MPRWLLRSGSLLAALLLGTGAATDEARVAVASNFLPTARELARLFEKESGHRIRFSSASTGKLHAQILHGAPFDLFLSADARRPEQLAARGLAGPGQVRTYAIGRLMFWMPAQAGDAGTCRARLLEGRWRLALANPDTAPYGSAARQALNALGLHPGQLRLLQAENVAQAFAFVASGGADGGFVSAAQFASGEPRPGCRWAVPDALHEPLTQKAALLKRGRDNAAARAFFDFLSTPEARAQIERSGYRLP